MVIFAILLTAACSVQPSDLCFSPGGDCDERVSIVVDSARQSVDVAIYSLNRESIVTAIIAAAVRGVSVRVLLDNLQSKNKKEIAVLAKFTGAGIETRRAHHRGIMHMKMVVVDERFATLGSFNFTDPATEYNDEVLAVLDCPSVASRFAREFQIRWEKAE